MDMDGLTFGGTKPTGGATQYWLTYPLDRGWVAAYRLTYHGDGPQRRARIRELRIVPGLPGARGKPTAFLPGANYPFLESGTGPRGRTFPALTPRGPFSFDAVRRAITSKTFRHVLAAVASFTADDDGPDDDFPDWAPPTARLEAPKRRGPGRPVERFPLHYAKFALRYHRAEHSTRREPSVSTRAILADQYRVPVTTIGKWIRIARQQGFLSPAIARGSRGGIATPAARALVTRSHK